MDATVMTKEYKPRRKADTKSPAAADIMSLCVASAMGGCMSERRVI